MAATLIDDTLRHGGAVIRQVNADLEHQLSGWEVAVREAGGLWSVVLRSASAGITSS